MARQYLAAVEHDCDGVFTRIYRVDVPAWMADDESMIFALEHGQIRYGISDPTEWFTVPSEHIDTVREAFYNTRSDTYCQVQGNIFR
jgi:hypothetical protein